VSVSDWLIQLQYRYAGTGQGWDEYIAARQALVDRMGRAPPNFPDGRDNAQWSVIRKVYLYDPAPPLGRLRTPVLAIFGELDSNIIAGEEQSGVATPSNCGGERYFTLRILPKADHLQLEVKTGSNAEHSYTYPVRG
jgi:pimeloyl-ACP methyl ester carboxylesterase